MLLWTIVGPAAVVIFRGAFINFVLGIDDLLTAFIGAAAFGVA